MYGGWDACLFQGFLELGAALYLDGVLGPGAGVVGEDVGKLDVV